METANASLVFLVLVALVALAVGLMARSWRRPASHSSLRVLSTLALGHRERLVEVLQGEEVLVLGVTSQQIQLIDRRKATTEELRPLPNTGLGLIGRGGLRLATVSLLVLGGLALTAPLEVFAQNIPLFESVPSKGGGTNYSVPVQTVILLTALSFLPAMLMLMTSFTRILIVLSLLRQAMGLVTTPPNAVLVGLALFITAAVMAPVTEKVYADAWQPYVAGRINFEQAIDRGVEPVKAFMLRQTRADDLNLFVKLSGKTYAKPEDVPLTAVIPAFAISEIRTAFLIGFVIYLPFLAIDFAVASILTALGMVMVSPITFSLPLKLIVFVLADGWAMLIGGLVDSFKMSA
ncbi:MAG: flagellar biosynthetic protein FliP [Betaproteobacteria bacterium]|nr:flagellar biosynthetic protein FliP [Betaproteobacteria bacterium]NDD11187.1 flagellar biosynthetic protein FliP [Betaproteobacteria bacterium]